jgi:hypothetical protein
MLEEISLLRRLASLSNPFAREHLLQSRRNARPLSRLQTLRASVLLDCLIIGVGSLLIAHLIIVSYVDDQWLLRSIDTAWFLNRAHLMWRGVFDDAFVYQATFPLLVGALNFITHDLVSAGLMVNTLALLAALVGTYLLGRIFYNRQIAWIGVIALTTIWDFTVWVAHLQTILFFNAVLVWCVLACWWLVRRPGALTAVLFALALSFALYTRLEGGLYILLLAPAAWAIHHKTHDRKLTLRVIAISIVVFGIAAAFYGAVLLKNSDPSSSAGVFPMLNILTATPIPWDVLSRRYTDTVFYGLVHWWPLWIWWLLLAGLIWPNQRYRLVNWAFAAFVAFNLVYGFVLSTWPLPRYLRHYVPFTALLIGGAALWRPAFIRQWPGRIALVLLLFVLYWPGLWQIIRLTRLPQADYRQSEIALDAARIDQWLVEQGWQDKEIFTLCPITPFTRSNFHLIYRLATTGHDEASLQRWWNSPNNLLPYIREHDLLLMLCNPNSIYEDWDNYLDDPSAHSEQLREIHRIGHFVFYRVESRSE